MKGKFNLMISFVLSLSLAPWAFAGLGDWDYDRASFDDLFQELPKGTKFQVVVGKYAVLYEVEGEFGNKKLVLNPTSVPVGSLQVGSEKFVLPQHNGTALTKFLPTRDTSETFIHLNDGKESDSREAEKIVKALHRKRTIRNRGEWILKSDISFLRNFLRPLISVKRAVSGNALVMALTALSTGYLEYSGISARSSSRPDKALLESASNDALPVNHGESAAYQAR